nr:MAG: hypothetical protein [Bacteriophage sp.]
MHTETVTIYSYSELSEEAKATAYKAWEPDYVFYWDAAPEFKEIRKPELDGYIRHRLSLFEPTGFYLDDVILGPAKQPTEGKVFGDVIEECLTAFFSACCEDVKYTQSQEYFAEFAENNEFEFYENGICIRHR